MTMNLPMSTCRKWLTLVWFAGAGLVFVIVLGQTLHDHYGDHVSKAWSWLLPVIMPTLSLMISVWTVGNLGNGAKVESADPFVFWLALVLSIAYLVAIALTILLQPFLASSPLGYIQLMNRSSFFIGPLQGLVTGSLGAFFVKRKAETAAQQ
jgi:hypothetical protein